MTQKMRIRKKKLLKMQQLWSQKKKKTVLKLIVTDTRIWNDSNYWCMNFTDKYMKSFQWHLPFSQLFCLFIIIINVHCEHHAWILGFVLELLWIPYVKIKLDMSLHCVPWGTLFVILNSNLYHFLSSILYEKRNQILLDNNLSPAKRALHEPKYNSGSAPPFLKHSPHTAVMKYMLASELYTRCCT